jgi:ribosomal protein S18 acetylase RimI-like enzyme
MMNENLERMIKLADEFFETKKDSSQISITEEIVTKLRQIHPSTMNEKQDVHGPIAWVLVIPTTKEIMEQFIAQKIGERELLDGTPLQRRYDALYLCSALVLPEHRGKGLAKSLTLEAIGSIRKDHPIQYLFSWAFSRGGEHLAAAVAKEVGIPLYTRPEKIN